MQRLPGAGADEVARALTQIPSPPAGVPSGVATVARQYGVVQSTQPGTPNTVTISLGGSTVPIAGVRYVNSFSPMPGQVVLVDHVGSDLVVIGALA